MATLEELTAAAQTAIDAVKTANGGDGMWTQVNNERRGLLKLNVTKQS